MSDYFRPSFSEKYRERLQEFLEEHPALPFDTPKELMKHTTNQFITDIETRNMNEEEAAEKVLEDLTEKLNG